MIIKNIIIQNKKLKINECSCAQIKHLQHQLRKDVIHLYHDQGIQWEFGDVKHSVQKYTYQLSANDRRNHTVSRIFVEKYGSKVPEIA